MKKVSIIIPNWNGAEKIKKHLPVVVNAARNKSVEEIIVVDDYSTDNSLEVLSNFPSINLVAKPFNSGFSSTVNLGVKKSIGEYVLLLNSDADLNEDTISNLLNDFDDEKVFSVGCNVGGLWSTAKFENGYFWHNQAESQKNLEKNESHLTLWVSGGSGMFKKDIWQELGGLDEIYNPFYEEDVDLGYRALKRGYLNLWEPKAKATHYKEVGVIKENFSKENISSIASRNQLIFIWKNITSKKLFAEHKKNLLLMLLKHPTYFKIVISALLRFKQVSLKRNIEKRDSKLTDEEVLALFD